MCADGNPFEYMDDWKIINECLLPEKEDFYSNLNAEDVTETEKGLVKILKTNFG